MDKKHFYTKLEKSAYTLLLILTCECVVGGGGRWLEAGPLSIRMALFIASFLASLPFVLSRFKEVRRDGAMRAIALFSVMLIMALLNGYLRGNEQGYIFADLTSILYLAIVPAYIALLNEEGKIKRLLGTASAASVCLAAIVIILHFLLPFLSAENCAAINTALVSRNLGGLFKFDDGTTRIYFKSSICFILPFIYYLYLSLRPESGQKRRISAYICMSLSFTAIVLSFTRSIWLGAFVAVLLFFVVQIRDWKKFCRAIAGALAGFFLVVFLSWAILGHEGILSNIVGRVLLTNAYNSYEITDDLGSQRLAEIESERIRHERLEDVLQEIGKHPILGTGLGSAEKTKGEGKIEFTYLDLWRKMGILGLLSFLLVLAQPYRIAWKKRKEIKTHAAGMVMSVLICFLFASIYNPFITSPIGLSIYALFVAAAHTMRGCQAAEA